MKFALLRKIVGDARLLLTACSVAIFAFAWIRVLIVASMERYQLHRIARNLPESIQRLSPVPIDQLISYPGLVGFTFEEPMTYLIMAVWTISRGSDCVSGQLGQGTLEMILAQPISRLRYIATHSAVTIVGVLVISLAAYAGSYVGVENTDLRRKEVKRSWSIPFFSKPVADDTPTIRRIPISTFVKPRAIRPAALNFFCLGVFLAGITTAASACDRYRWRTIGIIVAFYVVQTVIELTGMAVEGAAWLLNFTFFALYEPVKFVTNANRRAVAEWQFWAEESTGWIPDLGPIACHLVLLTLGIGGFLIAARVFCRRDLPAPL